MEDKIYTHYIDSLVVSAKSFGCENVLIGEEKRSAFNPDKNLISVEKTSPMETVYALAHEIGHLMDHYAGQLDYDLWFANEDYRVHKEMTAWVNAYNVLLENQIPTPNWRNYVNQKLGSYFQYSEVV